MPRDTVKSFTLKDLPPAKIKYLQNSTLIGNTPAMVVRLISLLLNSSIMLYNDVQMTSYIRSKGQTYEWTDKFKYLNEWVLWLTTPYFIYGIFGINFLPKQNLTQKYSHQKTFASGHWETSQFAKNPKKDSHAR